MELYATLGGYLFGIIGFGLFFLSGAMGKLGLKFFFKKMKYGVNMGLLFRRNNNGDFNMPDVVDLRQNDAVIDNKQFIFERDFFRGARFFGLPAAMYDEEDTKNTIGIYYQQTDNKGERLYNEDESPVLSTIKPAMSLDPTFTRSAILNDIYQKTAKDLFNKHKTQIMILMGIGIAVAACAWFLYELVETHIPNLQSGQADIIKQCISNIGSAVGSNNPNVQYNPI